MLYNKYEIEVKDFLNEIEDINKYGAKWLNKTLERVKNWTIFDIPTLEDINAIKRNMNLLLENHINITNSNLEYDKIFVDLVRNKMIEILDIVGRYERNITGNLVVGRGGYYL